MNDVCNVILRHRDKDEVIEQKSRTCLTEEVVKSSVCISAACLAAIVALLLLLAMSSRYVDSFETVLARDSDPQTRPRIAICVTKTFSAKKESFPNTILF